MKGLGSLFERIKTDPMNQSYTKSGVEPLVHAPKKAKILLIGQAPGLKAQETKLFFNDPSGDTLRDWLGVDREIFYYSNLFAVLPMDFYYLGKGKSGDLPPRKSFAEKWHPEIISYLSSIELTILIGKYAQDYYLKGCQYNTLTETVKHYQEYLPEYLPIIHPSPRNNIWHAKNPWFKTEVVPQLQMRVREIITRTNLNSEE